jgi:hypothetical protein
MFTLGDTMHVKKRTLILFAAVVSALLLMLSGCISTMNPRVSKADLHDYPGAYQYYIDNMDQYDVFVCNENRHTAIVMDKKDDKYTFKPQGDKWYRVTDKEALGPVYVWMTDKYRMDKQAQVITMQPASGGDREVAFVLYVPTSTLNMKVDPEVPHEVMMREILETDIKDMELYGG